MLRLITLAGDFVAEDVWWRLVQIITNNVSIQLYAAKKVYAAVSHAGHIHETVLKVASQVLGEFSDLLVKEGAAT